MKQVSPRARALVALALGLCTLSGCFKLALQPPLPHHVLPHRTLPYHARKHVCVVLVDDFDPLEATELAGLRNYLNRIGYPTTIYGQCYHVDYIANKMAHVYHNAPATRFVVVGRGYGQQQLPHLFRPLQGVPVELVVLLDKHLCPGEGERTEDFDHAKVMRLGPVSHPENLNQLLFEIQLVAAQVPVEYPPVHRFPLPVPEPIPAPLGVEELPLPQPVPTGPLSSRHPGQDDPAWNALDPANELRPSPVLPFLAPQSLPAQSPFGFGLR